MLSHRRPFAVCWIKCDTLTLLKLHSIPRKKVPNKSAQYIYLRTTTTEMGHYLMMLGILLTIAVTFLVSETIGYLVHRLAHWPKSGKLYQDHLHHHFQAYPPGQYMTEKYLGDLKTSFLPYFIPPFILLNVGAAALLPWPLFLVFLITSSTVSLVNNYLHDSFHVKGHWLKKFGWHRGLSDVHWVHHHNVKRNLGIYWYGVDRMLGTFKPFSAPGPAGPSPSPGSFPEARPLPGPALAEAVPPPSVPADGTTPRRRLLSPGVTASESEPDGSES